MKYTFLKILGFILPITFTQSFASAFNQDTLLLPEVLAIVNAHHPKMLETMLGRSSAEAQLQRAWGNLDPKLSTELYAKREDEKIKQQSAKAEINIPTYWGPKLVAGWKRSLGLFDQDAVTSLQGESSIGISFPLWKNILIDKNRSLIKKAEQLPAIAEADIIEMRNQLFLKVSEKYWEWAGTYEKYRIQSNLLSIAEFRLKGIIEEINGGERPRIDSIEMSQEILRRKGALIKSRREYEKAAISLSTFLWSPEGKPVEIPQGVIPNIPKSMKIVNEQQFAIDKSKALQQRPEILRNQAELSMADIDYQYASEQWKPDISMKLLPFSQDYTSTGISRFDYRIGVQADIPLLFRDARGQQSLASIKQQSLSYKLTLIQREISANTDDALSELLASYQQANTASDELNAAKKMEEVEREFYVKGEGSLFTVNLRERFSAESAAREIDALMNYHKAVAQYQWSIAGF